MSYHGMGWVDAGTASGSGLNCIDGKPVGRDGSCCPLADLYNLKWLVLAGNNAHRYFCEVKVRHLVEQMAEKAKAGSMFVDGLGAAPIDAEMQKGIIRALQSFNAIYPASRWHKRPGPAEEHCVYDKYVADPTDPNWPGYAPALQLITSALPAAERSAGHWALKDPAQALIYAVPGGNLTDNRVGTMPTINAGLVVQSTGSGNVVKLTPWATAFVDRMAPGWKGLKLPFDRRAFMAKAAPDEVTVPKDAIRRQSVDPGAGVDGGFPWLLAGGAVVLVGGGAAVWYAMRKGG